jgi:hypothetical protein
MLAPRARVREGARLPPLGGATRSRDSSPGSHDAGGCAARDGRRDTNEEGGDEMLVLAALTFMTLAALGVTTAD